MDEIVFGPAELTLGREPPRALSDKELMEGHLAHESGSGVPGPPESLGEARPEGAPGEGPSRPVSDQPRYRPPPDPQIG